VALRKSHSRVRQFAALFAIWCHGASERGRVGPVLCRESNCFAGCPSREWEDTLTLGALSRGMCSHFRPMCSHFRQNMEKPPPPKNAKLVSDKKSLN
jgi:hypothetical protein